MHPPIVGWPTEGMGFQAGGTRAEGSQAETTRRERHAEKHLRAALVHTIAVTAVELAP
ncbi:hypothetical protein [Streptomyces sp. NPDC023327]|uniref:hypothetical protein n=1 Tax=Streptomyces sp. NPDC023327 TaxID=3157088 RepID=UPI0033FBCF32